MLYRKIFVLIFVLNNCNYTIYNYTIIQYTVPGKCLLINELQMYMYCIHIYCPCLAKY